MKLSFPISAFNTHTYFFAISEKRLHENMQKTLRTTLNLFKTENKSEPSGKKIVLFLMLWHPKFGVTFGQRSHAEINIMWFATKHMEVNKTSERSWWQKKSIIWRCVAVSGKNVYHRKCFSTPTLLVEPRRWPLAKKWHHVRFAWTHGGK